MQAFVYQNEFETISIVRLAPPAALLAQYLAVNPVEDLEDLDPQAVQDWHVQRALGDASPPSIHAVTPAEIDAMDQNYRAFRDAWEFDETDRLHVNMERARDIHMGRIRQVRDENLALFDGPEMAAAARVDTTAEGTPERTAAETDLAGIKAQKQTLRDIPQLLDLDTAETPEELQAIWPVELNK